MLFDPIESFEDSPIQFTVEAHLEDSPFEQGLQSLENRVKSSSALDDKRIVIESYVNLNDVVAKSKLASLYTEIDKTINLVVNSKINIESNNLNNTIANQNGIFTKNLERILKDANKESFLSKIGSVITAPIRALGASANQIVKGSLFAVGEAAVKPVQDKVSKQLSPITSFVAERTGNAINNVSSFVQNRSGLTPEQTVNAFNYLGNKIDDIFDASKIYENIKSGIGYVGKLQYETQNQETIQDKFSKGASIVKNDVLDNISNNNFIKNAILDKTFSEASSYIANLDKDLINLNKTVISLLGSFPDLIREFSFYGAIEDVKKEKSKLNYELDPNKETSIFVGGLLGRGGIKTDDHAAALTAASVNKNIVSVRNDVSDVNSNSPPVISNILISFLKKIGVDVTQKMVSSYLPVVDNLLKNAFTGVTPDEIKIAANALYADELSSKTNIIAYCGGNLVAKGATELIDRGFPDKNIQTRGFAFAPTEFVRQNTKSFQSTVSTADPSYLYSSLTGSNFKILDQGKELNKSFHSLINYVTNKEVQEFTGLNAKSTQKELLKNSYVGNTIDGKKQNRSLTDSSVDFHRSIFDNKNIENLINSAEIYLLNLNSKFNKVNQKLAKGEEIPEFDLVLADIYKNVDNTLSNLKNGLIDADQAFLQFNNNALNINYNLGTIKQNFGEGYKTVYNEIQELNTVQNNAKGKITQYFQDLVKQNSFPQPVKNKLNTQLNNSLSAQTVDNMQFNYVQSKLYNGNNQATTPKVEISEPLNDLVNDFVKYGRFYSEKMWKEVYSIITNNAVNLGLDTLSVEQVFTNLNRAVNQTTDQTISLFNGLKQLEILMFGNLADKYRQTIKNSVSESSSLVLGYGQTQLKILTNKLYDSLSSGINNAIDNSDKYKSILSYSLDRLYVRIINDFQNLSEIERSNFEKLPFKLAYIAKFLIQAGIIAQTPLALPGQAVGSQLGAQASLPMGQALDGLGGILGAIPLKGEALQASVDIFREWFIHAFTQIGETIGGAALSSAEITAAIPIENVVQDKLKQFSAERQNTPALPGSSKKLVDELIKTKDDFENKIFESKSSSAIIDDLEKFNNIPAKKLYKVAQGVGSGISSRASKKDIIKELRDIDPNLEDLQFAVSKVYTEVKGISNEERKEITNKYNKLVSKVRQERQTLITSSLPENEIIDGLKALNNELYRFKKSFNISSGQINSILRLQEGIGKDINRFVEPSTSSNSFVLPSLEQSKQVVKPKVEYQPDINTDNAKVKSDAQYTGRMFSKGIEEGINQGKDEALQDVLVLAKSLIIVAQNALEIKSPSKLTEKLIGLPYVQGISKAIEKGRGLLKNSVLDLASAFIIDSENAFKGSIDPNVYIKATALRNADLDVKNSNPVDNIVKDLNKQIINFRPNFEQEKYIQDKIKDLNKQVRLNSPKIIQNKLEYKIDRETIRSEQGLNRVNRPIPLPTSIPQEKEIYRSKGVEQGKNAIEFIENSYNKLIKSIDTVIDKTKQFINGNKEIQRSVGYVQGLGQNWNEAKDKLGNYLSQFQVFGIQGSTFAKLGLGAIGVFAFAKSVEYLKNQLTELVDVSRQSSKVEQFFKDATSKPKENIERISGFANRVGLDRLSLLQSSAEQTVGLKTTGYDENKALSIVDKLTKVSVGRRFNADESSRFFRPILQIASKDKFSLEEIQQQLADIGIYGAPKLAAKATGFSNNQAAFLKATSQGEVSANVIGKDGLTNLERFVKLLEKTYGSSNELDPLVATTTRINNNFKQLQINTGKSIEPLLQLSDPVINGGLTLLSNNSNLVVGSIKTLGVISISLVIPSLLKMASSSKLLAGAFALVNEQGLRGAVSTTIGASKWAKWGLAATAAISSVNSFQSTYINNTNGAIKALDKLIQKEKERNNPRKNTSNIFNSEGANSRYKAVGDIFGNIGNTILSGFSLDAVGVVESIKGVGSSVTNTIYGSDNTIDTFGRSGSTANKDQNKNRQERDKGRQIINQTKNDINEANKIAKDLKEGKFVDPERLKNSQIKIAELNDAFKQVSPIIKENDKGIKDFSNTLEKLDDDLFNVSAQGRNLTAEMNKLKTQLEENKLLSLKIDLETEVNKSGLPFNDSKVTSLYDFSSEQKKLDTELELQEKLAKAATEKYNSVDYQNLLNSTVEGQLEKANQIKSDALQEQQRLIELQISKQKSVNNRRKELFNQEKEELMFINSSRKLKNEISQTELRNSKRLEIFNKTGNLDTVQSKFELAKLNVDSILNQSSQNSLSIDDNEKLYKKGLITTYEYQTNLLEGRKKQAELEGQFNDSLIELNNIEKEKANILLDLTSKQKEYDNKLKDNSLTISQTIIDNYGKVKKEIRSLNSEINNLTSESLNDLSSVLTDKIGVIKNIFSDSSDIKGNEYALKSYLGTLERISGIRINKNKLAEDSDGEYQAKLLFQIEVSKVNIQIQGLRLKKEGLIEELVIQRKILDIEQQKARFNADQDVEKAQINLQKAQIKQDPNEIALAQIDLNSALKNREFLTSKQDIERSSQSQLDNIKLRSLDVEGAKLSLVLKKDLIGNENLKPFGNVDPYKELSDFISRNLRPFENSYQYQKNMTSEVKYQAPLPQLNITNNFNGTKQDNLDYGNIGRQIGAEAMKAFQTYRSGIVNSVK